MMDPWIYKAKILRISDADSWWMEIDRGFKDYSEMNVRLYYYNMPETKLYEGVTQEEKDWGIRAKEYAEQLMPIGTEVLLKTHKDKTGKYGRLLADVYFNKDNQMIEYGIHMMEQGYVKSYYDEDGTEILFNV